LETQSAPDVYGALVEPGGGWAARLHPDFSTEGGGYMLIVGETEIVPSWHITGFGGDKEVRLSDQFYSSVGNGKPLINLGRVIGDSMGQLQDNIQTSINVYLDVAGYGFDRSHALLASGVGNMRDIMVTEVNYAENTLQNQGLDVTKLHWKDYATLGGFPQLYDKADELAAGDVLLGDGTDEIVLANESGDYIVIMDGDGALLSWFACSIEEGDDLAVGDVDGDGTDEIVFGDCSSDQIYVYEVSGLQVASFAQTFSPDDWLAVGDVTPEAGEEIVMADQDDHIYVFDADGNRLKNFVWAFGVHDALTVGDVNGDNVDEVVLRTETAINESDQITATFSSYVAAGVTLSQTASFERAKVRDGDALATGDVDGDGTHEILIGLSNHYLGIKDQRGGGVRWSIPTELMPFDGVIAGRFSGGLVDEILIADQDGVNYYYPDIWFLDQGYEAYRDAAPDQDVLFFIGHGTPDSWGPGLRTSGLPAYVTINPQFPLDFGDTNPVVYGATCLSGNYQSGDDDNFAEAFLDSGAAVYIGAVENSMSGTTERSLEWFLDNWEDGEAVGKAWFDMERAMWQSRDHDGDGWDFLLHEYNLYGDPKFGAQPAAADARIASPRAAQPPPSEIAIELPEIQVATGADGYDRATIPGGQLVVDAGAYRIPYWTHTVEITRGYRIQDLTLVKRSEVLSSEDLNLPVTPDEIWGQPASAAADDAPLLEPDDSWVPRLDQEFTWQVVDNPDGTTTLVLKLYPFYYQPLTGNARYHRGYDFQVISMTTTVEVDQLTISQATYPEGDVVPIELIVQNTGDLQDVLVDATIRRNPRGELVEGLLLRTLHDLSGLASFSLEWDSAGVTSGDYYVEVKLYDSDSNLLDQDIQTFRLGILSGEIASLEASPELFEVGEMIDISMVFENVGTLPLTGTAVIEVQTAEGLTMAGPLTQTIEGLAPGSTVEIQEVWDSTGVALGDYRVIGYVLYDARSTGASSVALTNLRRVYLPVVLRDF
ncbi:MAG: C25 family cysteine peptidase, partial [Anaerolineae bacterium]